jgi:hypothetical protein
VDDTYGQSIMHRYLLLAAFTSVCIFGCTEPPPPIARDLPPVTFPDRVFGQRVKSQFPVGSDERNLVVELRRIQGATFVGGWPCGPESYYVSLRAFIMNLDGGKSNVVEYTIHCNGG